MQDGRAPTGIELGLADVTLHAPNPICLPPRLYSSAVSSPPPVTITPSTSAPPPACTGRPAAPPFHDSHCGLPPADRARRAPQPQALITVGDLGPEQIEKAPAHPRRGERRDDYARPTARGVCSLWPSPSPFVGAARMVTALRQGPPAERSAPCGWQPTPAGGKVSGGRRRALLSLSPPPTRSGRGVGNRAVAGPVPPVAGAVRRRPGTRPGSDRLGRTPG